MNMKPYSESCSRNQEPIWSVLAVEFAGRRSVLEIGSGTGQHAVFFGARLPNLQWQTTELPGNHAGIRAWIDESGLENVLPPLALDVSSEVWPTATTDAVFSANTLHIMSWIQVEAMFRGIGRVLSSDGVLCIYGPFNYGGRFTSESNARFDVWLRARDPASGVRDFEAVDGLARAQGLTLSRDAEMPSNNRTLVWHRSSTDGSR
ncbi:MAG: DUF938 domain-containing protein [Acidiferrobacterales bacterium]